MEPLLPIRRRASQYPRRANRSPRGTRPSCTLTARPCAARHKAATTPLTNHKKNPQPRFNRNQQYSITAVSDGGGSVVERYAYSAYGGVTIADASGSEISNSAISNRYTYTGREWDEGLSLYHYRARMYDAVTGRFCSKDRIGYWDGSNLYSSYFFVQGTDPSGLCGVVCDARAQRISKQDCKLHIDRRKKTVYYGFGFRQFFEFSNNRPAKCTCCEYRQLIIEARETATLVNLNGRPVNRPLPMNGGVDVGDEGGDEDCTTISLPNGQPYELCYGSRKPHPPGASEMDDRYSINGCGYAMSDRPGIEIEFDGLGKNWVVRFEVHYRFLGNIVDTCNGGKVVLTTVFDSSCTSEINFANL